MVMNVDKINIKFEDESDDIADIRRCLNTLYATKAGSVPMDRAFGLSNEAVDYPLPVAKNIFAIEIIEKTEHYEPRVEVTDVSYKVDAISGSLIATITVTRAETEEEEDYEEEYDDNIEEGEDDE